MRVLGAIAGAAAGLVIAGSAAGATPFAGHYPPGQSGLRGAASPAGPGFAYTNFSRFFSNLEAKDAAGGSAGDVGETRYANISMFTWNSDLRVLGLRYGALAGIPFATGNLNPSSEETSSSEFGLGDVLITPVSLYHRAAAWDGQFQFTYWSSSGHFEPGSPRNRGAGFESLVWSLGGVWYPGADRANWSLSAVSRWEQNFEQEETNIQPGDDVVVDWGVGKTLRRERTIEAGVSGFATWQLSRQEGGSPGADLSLYRYFGAGPEASISPWDRWTFRVRAQWEFGTRNAVQGNNLWLIANCAF